MKVNNGSWNTLPLQDTSQPISFIVSEMKRRLGLDVDADMVCKTRIATENEEMSQLDNHDLIKDVLADGDFVYIGELLLQRAKLRIYFHNCLHLYIVYL